MADLGKLKKPLRKGEPPKPIETLNNLVKPPAAAKVPLQLRLPPELRRGFKAHALAHDMDANKLFEIVWDYYQKHHG